MSSHAVHSVFFNRDLLSIIVEFGQGHQKLTLAAVCAELEMLTGQVATFRVGRPSCLQPRDARKYLVDAALQATVRARVSNLSKQLHLTVGFNDVPDWNPKSTALLNEAASVALQVLWEDVDVIPWKHLRNVAELGVFRSDCGPDKEVRSLEFLREISTMKRLFVNAGEFDLKDIAHLKELEYLGLRVSRSCSNSTNALARLPKLEMLDMMSSSGLSLDFIGVIPTLRRLNLFNSFFADFSILGKYTELRQVDFGQGLVTDAGVSSLRNCKNLVELRLQDTEVTDISVIEYFPKLSILLLQSTFIKDFTPLSKAMSLSTLSLSMTDFSDLRILASLPQLRALYCYGSSVRRLEPLKSFPALKQLNIARCKIECYAPLFDLDHGVLVEADIFEIPRLVHQ